MKEICLHSEVCQGKESLHDFLSEQLKLPEWYGRNLDALYDCLTELREEIRIVVSDAEALEAVLGGYGRRLLQVLIAASAENPAIHLFSPCTGEECDQ